MRKIHTSLLAFILFSAVNAECCDETSFSGIFGGIGVVTSFDQDNIIGETFIDNRSSNDETKNQKSKIAFGGQIVLGYGYQFDNDIYVAVMHESNFLSKAKHELHDANEALTTTFKTSRKAWSPSFGLVIGYVVDDINFGVRGGISLNKYQYEQNMSKVNGVVDFDRAVGDEPGRFALKVENGIVNKTINETSPFIGVYFEKKFGNFIGYMNVDYVMKKCKLANSANYLIKRKIENEWRDTGAITNKNKHNRHAWKAAIGIKYNLSNF